jgi:S-adenosylmethionine synthetase
MGRETKIVRRSSIKESALKKVKVELFPWEKLDYVDQVKKHSSFNHVII